MSRLSKCHHKEEDWKEMWILYNEPKTHPEVRCGNLWHLWFFFFLEIDASGYTLEIMQEESISIGSIWKNPSLRSECVGQMREFGYYCGDVVF